MGQVTSELMREYFETLRNWGKWGPDDEIGTLNYVTPAAIVAASQLVEKGKVFPMAIPLDANGPQTGAFGRVNPLRTMMKTGVDAAAGKQEAGKAAAAEDMVTLQTHCATHWDGLGHMFYRYEDESGQKQTVMWNGYPASLVSSAGAEKCGIEKTIGKFVGRGVLLDIAKYKDQPVLPDGFGITEEDLDGCASAQGVEIRTGDFLLVRTGQMGQRLREKNWANYIGGKAPGLEFETLRWLYAKEIAAVAMDTMGVEVIPNRTKEYRQPWHHICIPIIGLTHGENFRLDELAADCAEDGRYEFLFVASSLPFTGGVGTPVNPIAVK